MLTGVHETLRAAGRALVLALGRPRRPRASGWRSSREAAQLLADDAARRERARRARARAVLERPPAPERLLDLARAARRAASARRATRQARKARRAGGARRRRAARPRPAAGAARRASPRRTGARRSASRRSTSRTSSCARATCCATTTAIRERERWRFRSIMVDEFQDTNRLQCELVDLLAARPTRSSSSSATSSSRSTASGTPTSTSSASGATPRRGVLALTQNYRSRPEVLAVVNHLFGSDFGAELPAARGRRAVRRPGLRRRRRAARHRQGELRGHAACTGGAAEARHVARRVRELVDAGEATPGEVVLLFAAGTDAERYEEALRAAGPADLPRDRARATSASSRSSTCSRTCGCCTTATTTRRSSPCSRRRSSASPTTRSCCCAARRRSGRSSRGSSARCRTALSPRDERLFRAFRQRYERLVALAARCRLERLCERIVARARLRPRRAGAAGTAGAATRTCASSRASRARTRSCAGPTSRASSASSATRRLAGARELEAVAEEEGADAVRLLTIHAAKGLEFPVVVVADAGRDGAPAAARRDPLRCRTAASASASPTRRPASARGAFDYERGARGRARGGGGGAAAALLRRDDARDRPADRVRLDRPGARRRTSGRRSAGCSSGSRRRSSTAGTGRSSSSATARGSSSGVDRSRAERRRRRPPRRRGEQLALFAAGARRRRCRAAPPLPRLAPVPAPPLHGVRRLSFTRARALRALLVPLLRRARRRAAAGDASGAAPPAEPASRATEVGDAVHALLERVDLRAPRGAGRPRGAVRARYPAATDEELARIGAFVARVLRRRRSPAASRRSPGAPSGAALRVRARRRPPARPARRAALADGSRALVVDYKTNVLGERHAGGGRRGGLPAAAARLRARLLPRRRRARSRSSTQFLERPDEPVARRSRAPTCPRSRRSSPPRSRGFSAGEFRPDAARVRVRGLPGARPRLRGSAPAG